MDINSDNKAIKLKAMDKLVEGHKLATQLHQILSQTGSDLDPSEELVTKILGSFNDTISVLDSFELISSSSSLAAFEVSQNASYDNDSKFEDSGDSQQRSGAIKGKRGCYKRKKRSETWTVESTKLDDTFSWRKYGQKDILNSKFPRSYFRCTHKYTQGCKATKQVQKVELEPKMFNISYTGNHTCNTNKEKPKIKPCDEIIIDSEELKSSSLTTSMKEEEVKHQHHGLSMEKDLSLVWPYIVFEDDHHHHEAIYGCDETSESINVLCSTDLMVFGSGSEFGFSENEELSVFDDIC